MGDKMAVKILYQIREETHEEKCSNCVNYSVCKMSTQREDVAKFFDTTSCKSYHYVAPYATFECFDDDKFCEDIVKLIEEKQKGIKNA